jgi:hypothetical protein
MTTARVRRDGVRYNDRRGPLSEAELAVLRMHAACRSCSAMPAEDPDDRVRIAHRRGCGGVIDRTDAG